MTHEQEPPQPIQAAQLPDFASMTEDEIRAFAHQIWEKFAANQESPKT
jgi:hypothetical protein